MGTSINKHRAEIESIDTQLVLLLNRRANLVIKIGILKRRAGVPLYDASRERSVLLRACQMNVGPMDNRAITKIFQRVMYEMRRITSQLQKVSSE
jgi:chorismate mutase